MAKKKQSEQYIATAKVMGKKFSGKGETIYEAIGNINPGGVNGTVILTVEHGKNSKDRIFPVSTARRIFNTMGLTREVALKNASLMYEGI